MRNEIPMTRIPTQTSAFFDDTLAQLSAPLPGDEQTGAPCPLPSWTETASLLENLRTLLLTSLDPKEIEQRLTRVVDTLNSQLNTCSLVSNTPGRERISSDEFLVLLPQIRQSLQEDTETALQSDPAVTSRDEVILCYPGLRALVYYRIARALYNLDVPLLPRLMSEIGHSVTGIDIHPGAQIGQRFFIDHGTGVVIGATSVIGNDVKIYQGVTLGARSFPRSEEGHIIKGIDRHPIIGDRVTIYAGATILGRIHIGFDSVIGGNVWITKSVPANSHVMQQRPEKDSFIHGDGI
jgi:serine O-acetyltransferase